MINNPYQQYRTTQAETADGGQLVVMLYEGAIRFLTRALCTATSSRPKGLSLNS